MIAVRRRGDPPGPEVTGPHLNARPRLDVNRNTAAGLAFTNSKQTQIVRDTGNSARRKPPRRSPVPV